MPLKLLSDAVKVCDASYTKHVSMALPEPVRDRAALHKLVRQAACEGRKITLHGKRHSQGGQSLLENALSVDLDFLQEVEIDYEDGIGWFADVECGATWDHVHRALMACPSTPLAPLTHQSSPYFSVGGSLSVNCHGRDPWQAPLAGGVLQVEVMLAKGDIVCASPTKHPDLFEAVLGGYGACGILLRARLRLKRELQLRHSTTLLSVTEYVAKLRAHDKNQDWPPMHHGWLEFSSAPFAKVISVDSIDTRDLPSGDLKHESLLSDDGMSLLYKAYRGGGLKRDLVWPSFTKLAPWTEDRAERTLNAMRANVRFSTSRDKRNRTDLLQEYFIPLEALEGFLQFASALIVEKGINLLTSTVRIVQRDSVSVLSYARGGAMACVVLNFNIDLDDTFADAGPTSTLDAWTRRLIDKALDMGGTFYLPYFRNATPQQFARGYPEAGRLKAARDKWDPDHRFDNEFLLHYFQ